MKVVRQSALHTGCFYSPGSIPGAHFCYRPSRPKGHSAAGTIMSIKNSNDTIGNRTSDLLICNAVSQPTALLHAPPINRVLLSLILHPLLILHTWEAYGIPAFVSAPPPSNFWIKWWIYIKLIQASSYPRPNHLLSINNANMPSMLTSNPYAV